MVAQNGFYLDIGDALLLGEDHKKDVILGVHASDVEGGLWLRDLQQHVSSWVPGLEPKSKEPTIQRSSPDTWVIISVNAEFNTSELHNHYMPGWFREQLPPEQYNALTVETLAAEKIQITQLQANIEKLMQVDVEDLEDEDRLSHNVEIAEATSSLAMSLGLHFKNDHFFRTF